MSGNMFNSRYLAKAVVDKKRGQGSPGRKYAAPGRDDTAIGGQGATDYSRGATRGGNDRMNVTPQSRGRNMPDTGWTGTWGRPGSLHRHDARVGGPRYRKKAV